MAAAMRYAFDGGCVDTLRAELRRDGVPVALEPQVFDLLVYLIERRDRVVSKDELLAGVWRGRIVSESTISSRLATLRRVIGDNGARQRLLRTVHRKGYRFVGAIRAIDADCPVGPDRAEGSASTQAGSETAEPARPAPERARLPTLVVLPWRKLSRGVRLEAFAGGLAEDLATALSRYPGFDIVASRHSGGAWAAESAGDSPADGRYRLEGSVRAEGQAMRVTARLLDTASGVLLWAQAFDLPLGDSLALQDRATAGIVAAVGPRLESAEIDRVRREPPPEPDAYALYLHGLSRVFRWSEVGMRDALHLFGQALQRDPEFAPAAAMAAYCYVQRQSYGWIDDRATESAICESLARQAAQTTRDDAVSLARAAHALAAMVGDIDGGSSLIERACRLNPNLALARYVRGWIHLFVGDTERATAELMVALQLSPTDPMSFKIQAALSYANFFAGRYDDASHAAGRALRARPGYLTAMRGAAAAHALEGRLAQARELMAGMRALDGRLRVSGLHKLLPFERALDRERWADGLHRAGLPD